MLILFLAQATSMIVLDYYGVLQQLNLYAFYDTDLMRYTYIAVSNVVCCVGLVLLIKLQNAMYLKEKQRADDVLNAKAYRDGLTGIYNRRYFDENIDHLISSLTRSGSSLCLMMIDVDFFKQYNDKYGHNEGDKCLKIIAKTLSETVKRVDDFVVRYGGEEFSVVLPYMDENGARILAEQLITNIRNLQIPHAENKASGYVTISIGVTTGKATHLHKKEDYIKRADQLLYISKQNGRNKYTYGIL